MSEGPMEDKDSGLGAAWDEARGRLFRPAPRPTRADTEAFVQRLMARLPEERAPWWSMRWLAPSLAFSAAALALSLALPAVDDEAVDVVASLASASAPVGDVYGLTLEDR